MVFQLRELTDIVNPDMNTYFSHVFEKVCREFLFDTSPIVFNKGEWWHKDKEIDVVALNEKTKHILFAECKWKDNVNAEKVFTDLKEKTDHVHWFNESREEHFVIFGKSFSKLSEPCLCFDLEDLKDEHEVSNQ